MTERGPRLARAIVSQLLEADVRDFALADLGEGFGQRRDRSGGLSAHAWYWWQVLRVVPSAVADAVGRARGRWRIGTGGGSAGHRGWRRDLRLAARLMRRRPAYAVAAVLTIGIGFGAAAAVLSVANGVWFRPLPFPDEGRIVRVFEVNLRPGPGSESGGSSARPTGLDADISRRSRVSPPLVFDMQQHDWRTLRAVAPVSRDGFRWVTDGDEPPQQLSGFVVTNELFDVLGVRPLLGRVFNDAPGTDEVMLGEGFWHRAFGGDPDVLERSIQLGDRRYRIVGVMADGLPYPTGSDGDAELWVPFVFTPDRREEGMRGARYLDAVARLQPDVTPREAAGEVDAFVRSLAESHPNHREWGGAVVKLRDDLVRPYRGILVLLLSAAGLFLMIAVINVSGLVAARRSEDRQDRAIRLALGASPAVLVRQGIVECLLYTTAGAALAAVLGAWVIGPVKLLAPADIPRLAGISLDSTVVLALVLGAVLSGVAIGIAGQVMAGTSTAMAVGRAAPAASGAWRGRGVLMATQVALTTVLLIGGAVLARDILRLANTDPGFSPEGIYTAPLVLSERPPDQRRAAYDALRERLAARGLEVALGVNPPVAGSTMRYGYRPGNGDDEQYWAQYHVTSSAYFSLLGIPLRSGRAFTEADDEGALPVVIVSDALARTHFAGMDPVGRVMSVVGTERTIVGVVGSTHHFGPDQEPPPELYVPFAQDPWLFGHLVIGATGDGAAVAAAVREEVAALGDGISVAEPFPFTDFISTWFAPLRFQMTIVGLLAGVGVLLAGIGLYGLIAYLVASRTREIGIRMALGASHRSVFRNVVGRGLALATTGVAIGVAVALLLGRTIAALVNGASPADPVALMAVTFLVLAVAVTASALPARRASSVDPTRALREQG